MSKHNRSTANARSDKANTLKPRAAHSAPHLRAPLGVVGHVLGLAQALTLRLLGRGLSLHVALRVGELGQLLVARLLGLGHGHVAEAPLALELRARTPR